MTIVLPSASSDRGYLDQRTVRGRLAPRRRLVARDRRLGPASGARRRYSSRDASHVAPEGAPAHLRRRRRGVDELHDPGPGPRVLGLIRAEFGLSSADAGAIASAFFAGAASTMLAGGAIADRIGTRPAVTLGFLLVAIGNLGTGLLAPTFPALLAWRVLGGLGSGFGFAAGAAYTRSIFDDRGRHLAQGLYGAAFLLVPRVSPEHRLPAGRWTH
jgi:hypothetical protein